MKSSSYYFIPDIEQKRQRSHYIWCRVSDGEKSNDPTALSPPLLKIASEGSGGQRENGIPCIPSLLETPPGEDSIRTPTSVSIQSSIPSIGSDSKSLTHVNKPKKLSNPLKPISRPRTFYFSGGSRSSTSQTIATIKGVQKSKNRRRELACFIETKNVDPNFKGSQNLPIEIDGMPHEVEDAPQLPKTRSELSSRKRPLASNEERRWRNENWTKPLGTDRDNSKLPQVMQNETSTSQLDYQSIALAKMLHQVALQETLSVFDDGFRYPGYTKTKIRPNPSKARLQHNRSTKEKSQQYQSVDRTQTCESKDEFVYDTFVRTFDQSSAVDFSAPDVYPLDMVDNHKVGILVITEQDQPEWDEFGEDEESDRDWNSEEEDENGESYFSGRCSNSACATNNTS